VAKRLDLKGVNIYYGSFQAVSEVTLSVLPRSVTAFIGPSGCGKTTVLRTLNRMHEVIPGARVEGTVLLDDQDIYEQGIDPVGVRRAIGMVFQRPNPFPAMSIRNNVVAGLRLQGVRNRKLLNDTAEYSLRGANLWKLQRPAQIGPSSAAIDDGLHAQSRVDVFLRSETDRRGRLYVKALRCNLREQRRSRQILHETSTVRSLRTRHMFLLFS